MKLAQPRVLPLPESEWNETVKNTLRDVKVGQGAVPNIFRTLAHHPDLMRRWLVFGNHVLFKSTVPARERELVILRIGWLCEAEYEWAQHVRIGKEAGLNDEEIHRIKIGHSAKGWSPRDVLLLVVRGLTNGQIARRLGISERTVKGHLTNVFTRLGVGDRTSAAL